MWSDIYDENFKDMCYFLAIPGISIVLTALFAVVHHFYRRQKKRSLPPADMTIMDEAETRANKIRFGLDENEVDVDAGNALAVEERIRRASVISAEYAARGARVAGAAGDAVVTIFSEE